ncbi:MAG: hypothetical protein AB7F99_02480 [Vicinamibacterales bacterium]
MKFVSVRTVRNRPGTLRELVQREDLVLTASGEPIGIVVGIRNDFEQAFRIVRQARAQCALARLRRAARRRLPEQRSA